MKNVLLIGAGGNLGCAVASAFKQRQWTVIGIDQNSVAAKDKSLHAVAPSSSIEDLQKAYLAASAGTKLNAVVNVSGGWAGGSVADEGTATTAELMLRQSLFSSFAAAHVFSSLGERGGLLLFTGAAAALYPTPQMVGYGVAKSAVHFLCESIAADPSAIPPESAVLTLLPITLDTASNRNAMPTADRSTWTPLHCVAQNIVDWSDGVKRPVSGSLVKVVTHGADSQFIAHESTNGP